MYSAQFTLAGHSGPVFSAQFSPDGQSIVSASGDNTLRVWELRLVPGNKYR